MLLHFAANFVVQEQESWSASQEDRSRLNDLSEVSSTGDAINKAQAENRARPLYISFVQKLLRQHGLLRRRWALCAEMSLPLFCYASLFPWSFLSA
jgi:hypothetical protein